MMDRHAAGLRLEGHRARPSASWLAGRRRPVRHALANYAVLTTAAPRGGVWTLAACRWEDDRRCCGVLPGCHPLHADGRTACYHLLDGDRAAEARCLLAGICRPRPAPGADDDYLMHVGPLRTPDGGVATLMACRWHDGRPSCGLVAGCRTHESPAGARLCFHWCDGDRTEELCSRLATALPGFAGRILHLEVLHCHAG